MSWLKPRPTKISGTVGNGQRKGPRQSSRLGPFSFRKHFGWFLEVKLQAKLDKARPAIGNNLRERGTNPAAIIYSQKLDVVESVEELCAKFERGVFLQTGLLGDREIPIVDAGASNIVAGQVSVGEQRNALLGAKAIGARIRVGTGGANEVGGIKPEISGCLSGAGSDAVAGVAVRTHVSGIVSERDRTLNVGTIQVVILLARVGISVKVDRLTCLKRHNSIELPTFGNFSEQGVVCVRRERQLIDAAEYKALWSVEVCDGAIEAVIVGIRVSGGAGTETGGQVNRLGPSIGGAKRQAVRKALVQSDLQLIAVRQSVAEVCVELLNSSRQAGWIQGIGWIVQTLCTSSEWPGTFRTYGSVGCLLILLVSDRWEVRLTRGDELAAETAYVNGFKHHVPGRLPLEAEVKVFRIGCTEVRVGRVGIRKCGVFEGADLPC